MELLFMALIAAVSFYFGKRYERVSSANKTFSLDPNVLAKVYNEATDQMLHAAQIKDADFRKTLYSVITAQTIALMHTVVSAEATAKVSLVQWMEQLISLTYNEIRAQKQLYFKEDGIKTPSTPGGSGTPPTPPTDDTVH